MKVSDQDGWPAIAAMEATCCRIRDDIPTLEYGGRSLRLIGMHASREAPRLEVKPHRHSHYEMVWILAGRGRARTAPGSALAPGTIVLHPPQVLHAWDNGAAPLLRLGLAFTLDRPVAVRPVVAWPVHAGLADGVRALLAEAESSRAGRLERMRARMVLLLAEGLAMLHLPDPPLPRPRRALGGMPLADLVDRFLADNLEQPLALDDVAVQVRLSVPSLTRHYRRERGCSVMSRLHHLRLREAARLLAGGGLAVKEVARRAGFADCSYFCRCFRQAFDRTPTGSAARSPVRPQRPSAAVRRRQRSTRRRVDQSTGRPARIPVHSARSSAMVSA